MNFLITGAASGIGAACAFKLCSLGHRVYALDRSVVDVGAGIESYIADVTDTDALNKIAEELHIRGVSFDGIISVAGIHDMVSFAESDPERFSRLTDINLVGVMRVVRAFHRLLAPKGRVVIVTSEVATLGPMPFNGLYAVSKSALETYAKALRQELNLLGQKVVTFRPGAVETPLCRSSAESTAALARESVLYAKQAKHFSSLVARFTGKPLPPERVGRRLAEIALARRPRKSYSLHRNIGLLLLDILPEGMRLALIKALLNRN